LEPSGPHADSIALEGIYPAVDGGRFPVKRVVGETLEVWADIFKPGHDKILSAIEYRLPGARSWSEAPMALVDNDRWKGSFRLGACGEVTYRLSAWTDSFGTALRGLEKWVAAGEDLDPELGALVEMVWDAARRAGPGDAQALRSYTSRIEGAGSGADSVRVAAEDALSGLMRAHAPREDLQSSRDFRVVVDRREAAVAAWYEMFHRSQGKTEGKGATFKDCERRLDDVESMGFTVVYLPPIHPIGKTNRRGPNNVAEAGPGDPGSPWAIGSEEGGHDAVNPELGTMKDFENLVAVAKGRGLEIALDLAFQCSPDHPYVRDHPGWFYHRKDGTIRYAENPPKKYYDIYPLAFDCQDWRSLWDELKRVTLFWVSKGVDTFRVDNPHTKPSGFWEWLISEVKHERPEAVFLAEAFTAPKPMRRLSKLGFSQSYTYFAWKNTKRELDEFLREFVLSDVAEYYRGNFFTNTPDILHAYLQKGGRPAFMVRLILAATLSPLYGIYNGFELCENAPREEGSEEYLDSEKYQYKVRDWDAPGNIKEYIALVNKVRRENPALQSIANLRLLAADNDDVMFFAKWTPDRSNVVAVAVNLDPHSSQQSTVHFPAAELGLAPEQGYVMRDLLSDASFEWKGEAASVRLDPQSAPARVFRLQRQG
jgi:starch synthase (maltosyl-transferring)